MSSEPIKEPNQNKISFNYKHGKVRVYKKVLQSLHNPQFIQFLIKPEEKLLFIVGLEHREHDSFPVAQYAYSGNQGLVLNGQRFIKKMSEIAGWTLDSSYVVYGTYIAEMNMFEFNLTNAVKNSAEKAVN